ncbi:MAG TPA: hypothetical protein VLL98_02325 [Rickettsiales bacterium]|nr:hypothetical protein [Rickettsiales bacterium]
MKQITEITPSLFYYIQHLLINSGNDSDNSTFGEIHDRLYNPKIFTPDEFAREVFYVICVAGFKQTTAKKMCQKVIDYVDVNQNPKFDELIKIYGNVNKVNAIIKVWNERTKLHKEFYNLSTPDEKLEFLSKLPHIGNITKYHIARNLGINFVKYDIWIQRLGVALYGNLEYAEKVSNSKLNPKIKEMCDKMFSDLEMQINEKTGYIDVVLWKACQQGVFVIEYDKVFFNPDKFIN